MKRLCEPDSERNNAKEREANSGPLSKRKNSSAAREAIAPSRTERTSRNFRFVATSRKTLPGELVHQRQNLQAGSVKATVVAKGQTPDLGRTRRFCGIVSPVRFLPKRRLRDLLSSYTCDGLASGSKERTGREPKPTACGTPYSPAIPREGPPLARRSDPARALGTDSRSKRQR